MSGAVISGSRAPRPLEARARFIVCSWSRAGRCGPTGRPLATAQLVDLAVTASGSVLALDGAGNQLLDPQAWRNDARVRDAARTRRRAQLSTIAADEGVGYVASPEGIWRIDLKAKRTTAVTAPAGLDLGHFERIRMYQSALIGIEAPVDGTRRVVRLDLNDNGRAITAASVIDTSIADARSATFATISGDELYYLAAAATASSPTAAGSRARPAGRFRRAPRQSALTASASRRATCRTSRHATAAGCRRSYLPPRDTRTLRTA